MNTVNQRSSSTRLPGAARRVLGAAVLVCATLYSRPSHAQLAPTSLDETQAVPAKNHAPAYQGTNPAIFSQTEPPEFRYGKLIRFEILTSDIDGDVVRIAAQTLPAGASFDQETREFSWTPSKAAIGEHELRFEIADDSVSVVKALRLMVVGNRKPSLGVAHHKTIKVAESLRFSLQGSDPDGDTLIYEAKGMPAGMILSEEGEVQWQPGDSMLGVHRIAFTVSDGQLTDTSEVLVEVEEEWSSFLLPGLSYGVYLPRDDARYGTFHGVTLEIVISSWIRRNNNRGPSHGRFYVNASVLRSTRENVPIAFLYGGGLALSVERNPKRRWLLPHYGVEVGGLLQDDIGHEFQATPYAGLHLWASQNVFVNASAGYLIVPEQLETLGGWRFVVGGNFTLW